MMLSTSNCLAIALVMNDDFSQSYVREWFELFNPSAFLLFAVMFFSYQLSHWGHVSHG